MASSDIRWDDSLLAHHVFASHLPQRLAHVVSEYCDSSPWKLHYKGGAATEKGTLPKDLSADELCTYNAIDARLTAICWQRMQVDLEPERLVYEHDLKLAAVCREMAWEGIGIDADRQHELSELAKRRRAALKGKMRSIIREPSFSPGKLDEVRRVLFTKLRGKFIGLTTGGLPSTANATLEALKGDDTRLARFADALLKWRVVGKIKSTYIDAVEINPNTHRTHYNWKPFGTVSGRLSCRFQSVPRWDGRDVSSRPREMYIPRKGNVFVYYDVSQAEMRLAAYLSADPEFIKACGKDVHEGNARNVFPEIAAKGWFDGDAKKDPARGKPYRDICKNLGFAIAYGAEAEKVYITLRSQGFDVSYRAVELILAKLRSAYRVYYKYAEANLAKVRECGYMRTAILGRIRWLGWFPKPTEVCNFPVQSALADIMNQRMIDLAPKLPRGASLVAQVHDSCCFDVPRRLAGEVERLIKDAWAVPVPLAGGDLVLPIDAKRGDRFSEL